MRLPTDAAEKTIAAAVAAGITVLDTAHAYGDEPGDNERLVARALRAAGGAEGVRIVTKGGMARPQGAWVPDGRAKAIRRDCEASLEALDGLPIDLYLLHAPDPRTPWRTSVRALGRLVDEGLVPRVGLANVTRGRLDEAFELAPVSAVQVALSLLDDRALRGGVVERCAELDLTLIAHSPLGGPRRAATLARRPELAAVAEAHSATPAEAALAWVLGLGGNVVAIPGATRPETARSAARAASLVLRDDERERLSRPRAARPPTIPRADAEVVLVMGIPAAGKSRLARARSDADTIRLNRDERGGTLRDLSVALDEALASGAQRIVVDSTYTTRDARSHVLDVAGRHSVPVRCVWVDTPLAQAQANMVERLLDRFGSLPTPAELKSHARHEPGLMAPTSQLRVLRELEEPSHDEGFAAVERVEFERERRDGGAGVLVAAATLVSPGWQEAVGAIDRDAPHLVFDWLPGGSSDDLAEAVAGLSSIVAGPVEAAVCAHAAGPPICWCRPPLPGLVLAFARTRGVDPASSTLVGTSSTHRSMAATLGARLVLV